MWNYLKNIPFSNIVRAIMFAIGESPAVVDFGETGSEPAFWIGKLLQIAALAVKSTAK